MEGLTSNVLDLDLSAMQASYPVILRAHELILVFQIGGMLCPELARSTVPGLQL